MADEQTPAPGPGQADTTVSQGFDFERGYNELRPEFTRATQELSTSRDRLGEYEQLFEALHDSDPDVQAAAFEALGLERDTGSQGAAPVEAEFVDPLEQELKQLRGVVDELRSARELETSARQAQEVETLRDDFIGDAIGIIEESLRPQFGDNFRFSEGEEEVLGNLAIALSDARGVPNVEGAYTRLYGNEGLLEVNRARWIATKTGAFTPPAGTTIPAEQRPKTARERADYIDQRVADLERQQ